MIQADKKTLEKQDVALSDLVRDKDIAEEQGKDNRLHAMTKYLCTGELPADKLERIQVLESAAAYEVNQHGVLCKVHTRDKQGKLGISMLIVVPDSMRGRLVEHCHQDVQGHASVLKTYQKLKERFWWPGMFKAVQDYTKYCAGCQMTKEKKTKTPITKHVEADNPGEVWVVDLLHYPTAAGFKYVLVAVDAYSRWVELEALPDKRARTVADALIKSVVTNTAGQTKAIVSDQGTEFKAEVAAALEVLKSEQRFTAAYRSEGHGLVERHNRSISERLRHMVRQDDPQWHEALPWAKLAHNNSVHRALSHQGTALTPAEVHLGRRMNLQLEADLFEARNVQGKRSPVDYARHIGEHLKNVQDWIKECRAHYNAAMEKSAQKQHKRKEVLWQVGDLVRLERPAARIKSKREKLRHEYDGPYEVMARSEEDTNRYDLRKVGDTKIKVGVAADRIVKYYNELELDTRNANKMVPRASKNTQSKQGVYEVDKIMDDQGSIKENTKKYLVKWKGWEGHPHEFTWEPMENLLHCADTIQEYEMSKDKLHESVFSVHESLGRHCTVTLDLNGKESAGEVIDKICEEAKIKKEDIVLVWASPPCSTFTRANWSNLSRGNNYRQKDSFEPVQGEKGRIAHQHDKMVYKIKEILNKFQRTVLENPAMGLERMFYMLEEEEKKTLIDLCAYGWPYKKPTNLWIKGFHFAPKGRTSTGRCEQRCGQGEVNPKTGQFNHYFAAASERKVRGKHMTCGMPPELLAEVLAAVAKEVDITNKVVLDLCSGFQSWKETALKAGCRYVAVDNLGDRAHRLRPEDKTEEEVSKCKRASAVLKHGDKILLTEHRLLDGSICWTVPGGKREAVDTTLQQTALRELQEETGLCYKDWAGSLKSLQVIKGPSTAYFIYELKEQLSEYTMREAFNRRNEQEAQRISRWSWENRQDTSKRIRKEDKRVLEFNSTSTNPSNSNPIC